jgi:ribosome-associated protein
VGGVEIAPGVTVPESALRFSYARSAGPGGQNVNKLATKAELRIALADLPLSRRALERLRDLAGRRIAGEQVVEGEEGEQITEGGELVITSQSERSQSRNRAECLEKLRELIVRARAEPKVRRPTRPSRGAVQRRLEAKRARSRIKRTRGRGGEEDA